MREPDPGATLAVLSEPSLDAISPADSRQPPRDGAMHTPPNPIAASLSTRYILPFGASFTAQTAASCRCAALDIDLARPLFAGRAAANRLDPAGVAPAVLWLSAKRALGDEAPPIAPIIGRWLGVAPAVLVVDLPQRLDENLAAMVSAYRLAEQLGRHGLECQIAVGLRGDHLAGGRRHLANLTLLRRHAEEWGVLVALDLTGSFDPYWEAEAGVLRLGERLAVVRVNADAALPSAADTDRVARRAIRAAIEQRPDVRVSIEPSVPWWQRRNASAVATSWAVAANRIQSWRGSVIANTFRLPDEERRWRSLPPR